ncbi:hypothetical protein C8R45DRAFT_1176042 [Mycena sanguinolenta]|nr:hypothetical protein C8R45DRAFT_1176042 [Mycena sanguinolenta]
MTMPGPQASQRTRVRVKRIRNERDIGVCPSARNVMFGIGRSQERSSRSAWYEQASEERGCCGKGLDDTTDFRLDSLYHTDTGRDFGAPADMFIPARCRLLATLCRIKKPPGLTSEFLIMMCAHLLDSLESPLNCSAWSTFVGECTLSVPECLSVVYLTAGFQLEKKIPVDQSLDQKSNVLEHRLVELARGNEGL